MSELGISPVYRHDTGFFKCSGSNFYGQDENSIELIVQGVKYIIFTFLDVCLFRDYFNRGS